MNENRMPKFGFQIDLVNMPKGDFPFNEKEFLDLFNRNFQGFGLKLQPMELSKEDKAKLLDDKKKFLEGKKKFFEDKLDLVNKELKVLNGAKGSVKKKQPNKSKKGGKNAKTKKKAKR